MTLKKKPSPPAPAARGAVPARSEPPTAAELQLKTWEAAVQFFTSQKFDEACELFSEAARGPAAHIADKARSYLQICQRKVSKPIFDFRTADDHFNYGVERLNARDFEQARVQFGRALSLQPDSDYIFYTLALCCGLAGDRSGACENLKRAIDLEPRNRMLARQDPEFSALASQSSDLRALLG
jgi:tetratricopeptide (TPR) repeat protein